MFELLFACTDACKPTQYPTYTACMDAGRRGSLSGGNPSLGSNSVAKSPPLRFECRALKQDPTYELLAVMRNVNGSTGQTSYSMHATVDACIAAADRASQAMMHPKFDRVFYVCKSSIERTPTTLFTPLDLPPQSNWIYVVRHDSKAIPMTRGTTGNWLFAP